MALFSTPIKTLDDLFLHTLQDIYYAENQIIKALPKMADRATNAALKSGFNHHLEETRQHVARLDKVFDGLGQKPKGVTCEAIEGIIAEAEQVMSDVGDKHVLDVAMASSAQAVEHYEMSRYGTLISLARQLGHNNAVDLLQQTLQEEKEADRKLTEIAESQVNRQAA